MEVDYDTYAEGEALLGWLNGTATISSAREFNTDDYLQHLATLIQSRLQNLGVEIAHLKMTFSPEDGLGGLSAVNLVRNDFVPELAARLDEPAQGGQLIINLRAEAAPHLLDAAVRDALAPAREDKYSMVQAVLDHLEHFRPGRPTPTFRDALLA
jgi:hypothetical protein